MICTSTFFGKRIKDDIISNEVIVGSIASFSSIVTSVIQLIIFSKLYKQLFIPYIMLIGFILQCIYKIINSNWIYFNVIHKIRCIIVWNILSIYGIWINSFISINIIICINNYS